MRFSSHSQTSWNAQNSIKLQCSSMNDHTVHHLLFHFYSIIFLYSVDLLIKSRVWPFTTLRQGKKIAVKNPNRKKSCTHKVLWVTSEKNDYRKTQGNAYIHHGYLCSFVFLSVFLILLRIYSFWFISHIYSFPFNFFLGSSLNDSKLLAVYAHFFIMFRLNGQKTIFHFVFFWFFWQMIENITE